MKILAIEPYYGGSHRAFLDGWRERSRHDWTLLTAPPHGWKWRMRHGAITFARQVQALASKGASWDVMFCSSMLNVPEFLGHAGRAMANTPTVVYFHENQLTYPVQHADERDVHFGLTNFSSALAADAVWFNSAFHRDEFLTAVRSLLKKMRPPQLLDCLDEISAKTRIEPPGVEEFPNRPAARKPGPLRILWAARWEFDKNPELFFAALKKIEDVEFRLSVLGEQFSRSPEIFAQAQARFADRIDHWGFLPNRNDYRTALGDADVAVSTANHEFFGLSMVEAAAAGAQILVPNRLAYPEVFAKTNCFYENKGGDRDNPTAANTLAKRLRHFASTPENTADNEAKAAVQKYLWPQRTKKLDDAISRITRNELKNVQK